MKNNFLRNYLNPGRVKISSFSFLIVLFVMATTTFGQVIPEKVRTIPTVEGDPTTEFLIVTHATDSSFSHSLFNSKGMFQSDDAAVEFTQTGDYVEYQVISPTGGDFAAVVLLATKGDPGEINVSAYKTESEVWSETGSTINAYNNSWTNFQEHIFPLGTLEAGVYYTVRITWLNGVNFKGLSVTQTEGSTDATLSDLKLNGTTVEGFDSAIVSYTVPFAPGEWVESIEAIPNDANATVSEIGEIPYPENANAGTSTSIEITVTSESGIEQKYMLTLITPVSIYGGVEIIDNAMANLVYFNNGVKLGGDVLHDNSNGDYLDYYVYSEFDGNFSLTISCVNGDDPSESYFNVSTFPLGADSAWTLNPIYSQKIPVTYNDLLEPTRDREYAQDVTFYFSLKEYEPTILRIYSVTDKSTVGNIYGYLYGETFESIDASLSDLKVDGATVEGFDPYTLSYSVAVQAQTVSATVDATTTDAAATVESGTGSIDLTGDITRDTISVLSEVGGQVNYMVNLIKPIEVTGDSMKLMMGDQVFKNEGASSTNAVMNWLQDGDYVEYYIYSKTDKDIHLVVSAVNGNQDTVFSTLYVSTYDVGSEWDISQATGIVIPHTELNEWAINYSTEVKYNLSLEAGKAVKLRLYSKTNATNTLANIYGLTIVDGSTDFVANDRVENNAVKVWGGTGRINVQCNEAYLGGTVQIYDITGSLVTNRLVNDFNGVYKLSHKGLYFVKVIGANKQATTVKCIVK